MNTVIVLDTRNATLNIYSGKEVPGDTEKVEEFLREKGHHVGDCDYMIGKKDTFPMLYNGQDTGVW